MISGLDLSMKIRSLKIDWLSKCSGRPVASIGARALEAAGLDLEQRRSGRRRPGRPSGRSSSRHRSARFLGQSRPSVKIRRSGRAAEQDIGGGRRDDVFQRPERHHARHAARQAAGGRIIAEPALGLIRHAVVQHLLILGRQRRLLAGAKALGLIERALHLHLAVNDAGPLALPIGRILAVVGRQRAADRRQQRHGGERAQDHAGRALVQHDSLLNSRLSAWSGSARVTSVRA